VAPVVLIAWLVHAAWRAGTGARAIPLRTATVTLVAITLWAVSVMGHTPEQLDRIGMFNGLGRLPARFGERAREMARPWEGRQAPSAVVQQMRPFFDYSARCTSRDTRLLVAAHLPEVLVLARRAFAGGQMWFMPGALTSPADHALVMHRLSGVSIPLAVIRRPQYDEIAIEFPQLDAYIRSHFSPIAEWSVGGDDRVVLMADSRLSTGRDAQTGWPCFR
jgi:hypothetical protein